jgi:hypothetical protein
MRTASLCPPPQHPGDRRRGLVRKADLPSGNTEGRRSRLDGVRVGNETRHIQLTPGPRKIDRDRGISTGAEPDLTDRRPARDPDQVRMAPRHRDLPPDQSYGTGPSASSRRVTNKPWRPAGGSACGPPRRRSALRESDTATRVRPRARRAGTDPRNLESNGVRRTVEDRTDVPNRTPPGSRVVRCSVSCCTSPREDVPGSVELRGGPR